jgi:dTDP-4-amino-4,6-dideoxygalactose transaminase
VENVDEIIATSKNSIKHVMELMNTSNLLIALVVDKDGKLERTVTDGDIRRFLLGNGSLEDVIEDLPNNVDFLIPISVDINQPISEVSSLMYFHGIEQVPVLDSYGCPIGLHLRKNIDTRILLSTPHMGGDEQDYISQAFDTNWLAPLGPNVDALEREISDYIGGAHVAVVNTGTSAIHLALLLLNVSRDDIVFCQSFTFVASANPILYQGATPVFIDSEPNTWNISPVALRRALSYYKKIGKLPKAIIIVHLYGRCANMKQIMNISNEFGIPIIEDAAESFGALYQGEHSGTIGKFGVFSFNGNKIITTSGGGALVSYDEALIKKARFLSTQSKDPALHYEHSEIGYNYRMSNVLAGIGRGQLKVLDHRVKQRREVQKKYKEGLISIDAIEWMPETIGDLSNCWLSVFSINPKKTEFTPIDLISFLNDNGIEARPTWKPLHMQPLFSNFEYYSEEDISFCSYLFDTGVCLPSSSNISSKDQTIVIMKILEFFDSNST